MKEAAGQANLTVITIVLIGVVAAVGAVLIPRLLTGLAKRTACSEKGGQLVKSNEYCEYKVKDSDGSTWVYQCKLQKCSDNSWACTNECPK